MSKDVIYKQVKLQRTLELGESLVTTTTHILTNLAVVGRFVELKDNAVWNTWQVVEVSKNELSAEQAKKLAEKHHKGWNNNI